MICIGEKLNSSIPNTLKAIQSGEDEALLALIRSQEACGAEYLDLNTAMCGEDEKGEMTRLISLVLANSSWGIMIDSPSVDLFRYCLPKIKDRPVICNSLTLTDRYEGLLPLALEYGAGVVALPLDEEGVPPTAPERIEKACRLVEKLLFDGLPADRIYLDCVCETVAVGGTNALVTLDTIREMRGFYPAIHLTVGLSNVSFGLPKRSELNASFLSAALYAGLDSAIYDVTSKKMQTALKSTLALLGRDEYCMDYISFIRESGEQG